MNKANTEHRSFFEYLKLAKEELKILLDIHPELSVLSARELEVFDQLLLDKTLAVIAEEMQLSYSSVHFHCRNIYKKLDLSSRRQLLIAYKDLCR